MTGSEPTTPNPAVDPNAKKTAPPPPYTADFDVILRHELAQVRCRREHVFGTAADAADADRPPDTEPGADRRDAQRLDLIGLALSGGGIRSGTFNLGILQALAHLDLLKRVDYISSVSGGGYIHAWLAAWVRREPAVCSTEPEKKKSPIENVSRQLAPSRVVQSQAVRDGLAIGTVRDDEPAPVHHLREYSRYLAPKAGLLSLDTWALVGSYLRNALAGGLLFVVGGVVLSLACRLLVHIYSAGRLPRPAEWAPFVRLAEGLPFDSKNWRPLAGVDGRDDAFAWFALAAAVALLAFAQCCYRWFVSGVRAGGRAATRDSSVPKQSTASKEWRRILCFIVLPCLLASVIGLWLVGPSGGGSRLPASLRVNEESAEQKPVLDMLQSNLSLLKLNVGSLSPYAWCAIVFGLIGASMGALGLVLEWAKLRLRGTAKAAAPEPWGRTGHGVVGGLVFGAVFGVILTAVVEVLGFGWQGPSGSSVRACLLVAFGPALLMIGFVVCGYLEAIICGRHLSEPEREWRARVGAMTLTVGLGWAAVFAVVLYLPWLAGMFGREIGWAAVGGWAASGAATYMLRPAAADRPTGSAGSRLTRLALSVAPLAFLAGIIALTSILAHNLSGVGVSVAESAGAAGDAFEARLNVAPGRFEFRAAVVPGLPADARSGDFIQQAEAGRWPSVVFWLIGLSIGGCIYARWIDPNLFSLHAVYGNRLVRCYLAASRKKPGWTTPPHERSPEVPSPGVPTGVNDTPRTGDLFTGFGHRDDFSLLWLQPDTGAFPPPRAEGVAEPWQESRTPYLGPYPLFNTTLNLVAGADLATQDRKGESFVLSPGYSGSACTGWARFRMPKNEPDLDRNLTVGRAMTISGAAVDPNMRNYQSAGLTALLTVLNLRLGWWIENPAIARPKKDDKKDDKKVGKKDDYHWSARTPTSAKYLIWEAAGYTRSDTDFVHLSDGGHFDNTGAYELIRRRCRFIIVIDAAEDALDSSENLANLMRLVRTDFGVRIEMDTSPLRKGDRGLSSAHAAVGLIRYDDVDHGAVNGTLLFIRSSMTGDEPADLLNYAATNPPFPHHGTIDQFFDESQFESYRALGHHIGSAVFGPAANDLLREARDPERKYARRLFAKLRERWAALPGNLVDRYHAAVKEWLGIEGIMRSDSRLARLTLDMYPELNAAVAPHFPESGKPRSEPELAPFAPDASVARWAGQAGEGRVAELRAMAALVQMMETAWMQMDLDDTFAHALQRGWMNCFRRYTVSGVFQEYWPVLRPMYAPGFARFCERVLAVAPLTAEIVRWDKFADAGMRDGILADLSTEFQREWATVLAAGVAGWEPDYLAAAVREAAEFGQGTAGWPMAWVFRYAPPGRSAGEPAWDAAAAGGLPPFPVGVAAVRPCRDANGGSVDTLAKRYYELVFWVRGSHRSANVGQECLSQIVGQVSESFRDCPHLRGADHRCLMTRFPRVGGTAADSYQRALWTTFFNDHDFAAYKLIPDILQDEIRLRRWLPRTRPGNAG